MLGNVARSGSGCVAVCFFGFARVVLNMMCVLNGGCVAACRIGYRWLDGCLRFRLRLANWRGRSALLTCTKRSLIPNTNPIHTHTKKIHLFEILRCVRCQKSRSRSLFSVRPPQCTHQPPSTLQLNNLTLKRSSLVCPRSVEVDDMQHMAHSLQVQVLGTEETWNTPSLILATNASTGGKAVFSQVRLQCRICWLLVRLVNVLLCPHSHQVHLEADPASYEHDDAKYAVLRQSNAARMEIFGDLLSTHLAVVVRSPDARAQQLTAPEPAYTRGYFLGDYMVKFELLERLQADMTEPKTLKLPQMTVRFCGHREEPPAASGQLLPVLINSCPEDFSTVDYFEVRESKRVDDDRR